MCCVSEMILAVDENCPNSCIQSGFFGRKSGAA